jgi:hypothetical protein
MSPKELDDFLARVSAMNRAGLIQTLRNMHCEFALDFTDEFLDSISIERLRHIVIAASVHDSSPQAEISA